MVWSNFISWNEFVKHYLFTYSFVFKTILIYICVPILTFKVLLCSLIFYHYCNLILPHPQGKQTCSFNFLSFLINFISVLICAWFELKWFTGFPAFYLFLNLVEAQLIALLNYMSSCLLSVLNFSVFSRHEKSQKQRNTLLQTFPWELWTF